MINKKMKIWIPKKIAPFYYKDIDFKIENYVLDKDITNIIGNGHLIKKAIKLRHVFYWLLLMLGGFHFCWNDQLMATKKLSFFY